MQQGVFRSVQLIVVCDPMKKPLFAFVLASLLLASILVSGCATTDTTPQQQEDQDQTDQQVQDTLDQELSTIDDAGLTTLEDELLTVV